MTTGPSFVLALRKALGLSSIAASGTSTNALCEDGVFRSSTPPNYMVSSLRRRATVHCNRGATTRTTVGGTAATPAGTIGTTADASDGPWQTFTTTAVSGNQSGGNLLTNSSTGSNFLMSWLPKLTFRVKTPATITSLRYMIGMSSFAIGDSDDLALAGELGIVISYSTAAGDGGWVVRTSDGATTSTTGTLLAIAASTAYIFVIDVVSTTSVEIWMGTTEANLSKVATVTANLPAASTEMWGSINCTTLSAATRNIGFGHYSQMHL